MAKKLFVGGLPYAMSSTQLEEVFSKVGKVASANIVFDKMTKRSKGFGFVEMESDADADSAIRELNESEVLGRKITVSEAREKTEFRK